MIGRTKDLQELEKIRVGSGDLSLKGKRVAVVLLSEYPHDPRPRREAETMAKEGMKVEVICLKGKPGEPAREMVQGVDVLRLPIRHRRGGKLAYLGLYGGFLILASFVLTWRSLTRRYHLVHVHNMPDILVFSAWVPKLLGAKVLLDLHDPMPELMMTIFGMGQGSKGVRLLRYLERRSIAFADAMVTVSDTFRQVFCARSCPAEKAFVVMNAPDEEIFPYSQHEPLKLAQAARPFVVMFHGSLVERHGLGLAVEALGRLRALGTQVELRVYGKATPHLEEMLQKAKEVGLAELDYRGAKTLEEIVRAIDDCDLGIVPNLRSCFTEINTPTRIFEFLARGKPVIAPSGRGVREYFGPDELLLFELGNAEDLARQIDFAVRNPDAVAERTRRGQQVYQAHRWSRERRAFLKVVEGLLHGNEVGESQVCQSSAPASH